MRSLGSTVSKPISIQRFRNNSNHAFAVETGTSEKIEQLDLSFL